MVIMNNINLTLGSIKLLSASYRNTAHLYVKLLLLFSLSATSFHSVSAQYRVYGKVIDSTGKPLPNANVLSLNSKDSALVKGMLTNEAGTFAFENISTAIIVSVILMQV